MSNFSALQIAPEKVEQATIAFGEWLPDLMNLNNPGNVEALNVIPKEGGYSPFFSIQQIAGLQLPFGLPCKGAISVNDRFGANHLYAADKDNIYYNNYPTLTFNAAWSGGPNSDAYYWQFMTFGEYFIAVHPQVSPKYIGLGIAGSFVDLPGSPPTASCGCRVGDFLVLGGLTTDVSPYASSPIDYRIRWSGFNNPASPWISDPSTQADFQDMPSEGGAVVALAGREVGTIFQERSISRMTYVGPPTVFSIETAEENRGALCVGGVVDVGTVIFFLSEEGFFVWNGANSTPIGDEKVNRYFFSRLNYSERRRVIGAVDYENECIRWAFPVGTGITLDEQMIYSYKNNRWSHALYQVEYMLPVITDAGATGTDRQPLAGFDNTHFYGYFNNPPLAAEVDTAEYTAPSGDRVLVNSARPIVDLAANSATVAVITRDQLIAGAETVGPDVAQELTGEAPVIAEGRYIRARIKIPAAASWLHAVGIEIWRKALGRA